MTKILFVCLGNICRSPTAEAVFSHRTQEAGLAVFVDSAGTSNWHVGGPPDSRAQAEALRRGIDMSAQRARQFHSGDFNKFNLIIAMDRKNLNDINRLRPESATTPAELFLDYAPDQPLKEVPDPYYTHGFDGVFDLIDQASLGLIAALKGSEV